MAIIGVDALRRELGGVDDTYLISQKSDEVNLLPYVGFDKFFEEKFDNLGSELIKDTIEYAFDLADENEFTPDKFKGISRGKLKQQKLRNTLVRSLAFESIAHGGRSYSDYYDHIWNMCDMCGYPDFENNDVADSLYNEIDDAGIQTGVERFIKNRESEISKHPKENELENFFVFISSYGDDGLRISDMSEYGDAAKKGIMSKLDEYLGFVNSLIYTLRMHPAELKTCNGDIEGAYEYLSKYAYRGILFGFDDNVSNMLNSVLGRVDECSEWLDDNNFTTISDFTFKSGDEIQKRDYGYLASSLNGESKRTDFVDDIDSGYMEKIGRMMKFLFGDKHGNYNITINVGGEYFLIENFIYSGIMACELETFDTSYSKDLLGRFNKDNRPGEYGSLKGGNDYRFALRTNLVYYTWQSLA
nr:MAG TPA: hypothetical protein [Caudoviricetes sp.]